MNDMQHFDNYVKSAFDDYAPDTPPGSWEKIMAERKRRKPAPVWWYFLKGKQMVWIAGLLLATATGIGLYRYLQTDNEKSAGKAGQQIFASAGQVPEGEEKINTKTKEEKNGFLNNETVPGSQSNTQQTRTNDIPANEKQTGASRKKKGSLNIASVIIDNNENTPVAEAGVSILANDKSADKRLPALALSNKKNSVVTKSAARANFNTKAGDVSEGLVDAGSNDNFLTQGSLLERLIYDAEKISSHSLLQSGSEKSTITRSAFADPGCPALEKDAAANKQYWELYAGPDYTFKKYTDTANSAYLEKRKASTSFQSAFSAGARYTRVFNNGISIRAGINFSQVNEKFSFLQDNFVQITYITNASGDTTGSYSTRGTRYKTSYNHYKTADVPILIGYEIGNGKLHANLNAGAVINIYSWQKGDLLDTSFQPVNITTGKGVAQYEYKTNMGIGFMGAVSVYYKLGDRLHLLAEPFIRYNFSPMNNDNFSLQEKFTTIGLRLGIRMDLK